MDDIEPRLESGLIRAAGDGKRAQRLHHIEELPPFLLFDHISEKPAERAYISSQRLLFDLSWDSKEFVEPFLLIISPPDWLITHSEILPTIKWNRTVTNGVLTFSPGGVLRRCARERN